MFELKVLGALQLSATDGRSTERLLRQGKRTALLAYLGAALPQGLVRRDKLLALFWPEADESHARAALNQALYVLRGTLGEEAILVRGDDEVGLNDRMVQCDAVDFERVLVAGRPADALALYRGDLLDGFFVSGAPEFERWLERERARLRQRASEATWMVAEREAVAGDSVAAGRWARQAADLLPADEAVTRRLMTFLVSIGDRAGAIRAYEAFASALRTEFELEPSADTRALAATIREDSAPPSEAHAAVRSRGPGVATVPFPRPRVDTTRRGLLAGAIAVALGALALWSGQRNDRASGRGEDALPRLAVLPFTNLSSPEEMVFTDGMTDEITARLAQIRGLLVISSTSANEYRNRSQSLREIGRELGVEYVLDGTIRTDRPARGEGEIRVTPQLIRVADDVHLWSERYTATLIPGEIFRVQADIAEQVAEALQVTLQERERRSLAAQPTQDLQAYHYYLRGQQYFNGGTSEQAMRMSEQMHRRAIAADSGFALAHARLAIAHARLYWFFWDRTPERLAEAKRSVDRAIALDPALPEARLALGYYHYWGHLAYEDALVEFRAAQELRPNDPELFLALGNVRRRQGKLEESIADFTSAWVRDPRNPTVAYQLGMAYALMTDSGRATHYFDRVIALAPESPEAYWGKARLFLNMEGSTAAARAVLSDPAAPQGDPFVQYYGALADLFDRRYDLVLGRLRSAPESFGNQWRFIPRAQLQAEAHHQLGHRSLTRAYYDSARALLERRSRAQPEEANYHSALGIALAGLGRKADAIAAAQRAVELLPTRREMWRSLYRLEDLARVYAMVGEYDTALEHLERLAALPGGRSVPFLRLDPVWDPLRHRPRFQSLLREP